MKKTIRILLVLTLITTMVGSQALAKERKIVVNSQYRPGEDITIEDVNKWLLAGKGGIGAIWGLLVTQIFQTQHPDVRIVGYGYHNIWGRDAIMTSLATGEGIPWFSINALGGTTTAVADGLIADITKYIEPYGLKEKLPWDAWSHLWIKGRCYGLPYNNVVTSQSVLYRKDLLKEAGLPIPSPNWTWENFRTYAKKLTNPKKGMRGVAIGAHPSGALRALYPIAFSWGAPPELLIPDPTQKYTWRSAVNTPPVVRALKFLNEMVFVDKSVDTGVEMGPGGTENEVKGNRAAMIYQQDSTQTVLHFGVKVPWGTPPEKYVGLTRLPQGPEGLISFATFIYSMGFNATLSPEELKAAVDYFYYIYYGYGKALMQLCWYLTGRLPYERPFALIPDLEIGVPPRRSFFPGEMFDMEELIEKTPRPPQHSEFGIPNYKNLATQDAIASLVQEALTNPNFDAQKAANEKARYINDHILNYKIKGQTIADIKGYFTALEEFYKKNYPKFYSSDTYREMWEKYYKIW